MKKFFIIISIFLTFSLNSISFAKNGKGELKLDTQTMEHLLMYFYGAQNTKYQDAKIKRATPTIFVVSEDGDYSSYYYCPYVQGCVDDNTERRATINCEKVAGKKKCFTFAKKRRVVWKNGGPKLKITRKDLKSPYVVSKKIQDAGYYDGDISLLAGIDFKTGQIDDSIKITGEDKDNVTDTGTGAATEDLVNQLENLKKLYESGALSVEEFTKAKSKLLNQ